MAILFGDLWIKTNLSCKLRPRESAIGGGAGAIGVADPIYRNEGQTHEAVPEWGLGQIGVAVACHKQTESGPLSDIHCVLNKFYQFYSV